MLGDVVAAALAVGRVLVVTDDASVVPPGAEAVPDPGDGLGAAVAAGLSRVDGPALVLNADLPCATPDAIRRLGSAGLALVEAGHVSTVNEAFDLYISRNGPAYVEREKMTPPEVVQMLLAVGGLATLAHPRDLGHLEELLAELKEAGLTGMEVYYQDYGPEEVERLRRLAEKFGLLPLGGSDFHGLGGPQQREPGDIPLPWEPVQRLLDLAQERDALKRTQYARPGR